jgi:hypothetical protein
MRSDAEGAMVAQSTWTFPTRTFPAALEVFHTERQAKVSKEYDF